MHLYSKPKLTSVCITKYNHNQKNFEKMIKFVEDKFFWLGHIIFITFGCIIFPFKLMKTFVNYRDVEVWEILAISTLRIICSYEFISSGERSKELFVIYFDIPQKSENFLGF